MSTFIPNTLQHIPKGPSPTARVASANDAKAMHARFTQRCTNSSIHGYNAWCCMAIDDGCKR